MQFDTNQMEGGHNFSSGWIMPILRITACVALSSEMINPSRLLITA